MEKWSWLPRVNPVVRLVGGISWQVGWRDPRRVLYDHELMALSHGSHTFDLDERRIIVEGPGFIILPPSVWHTGWGPESEGTRRAWTHFDWTWQPLNPQQPTLTYAPAVPRMDWMRHAPECVGRDVLFGQLQQPHRFFELHDRLEQVFNDPHAPAVRRQVLAQAIFRELLALILFPAETATTPRPNASTAIRLWAPRIRSALETYADLPFAEAPSLRSHMAKLGPSYDHQCRIFRKAYGVTPLQFVNAHRIDRAKSYLRDTLQPVNQIAFRLGFDHIGYFNRLFRQITGMTPSVYRDQASGK